MAEMTLARNSRSGEASVIGSTMKTSQGDVVFRGGSVWLDPVLTVEGLKVANVNFAPCARSHWHWHEKGQLLRVMAGSGWICDKGADPRRINVGDVIWCPAGTVHWHGADDASYMVHQTATFGEVEWYDEVTDEEYGRKRKSKAHKL